MIAAGIRLPNVRRIFVPDEGYVICDSDLSGADAQVVAWEAGDEELKAAFRAGVKIHVFNARSMFPEIVSSMTDDEIKKQPVYKKIKAGVHATNYGASPNALVVNAGFSFSEAHDFQERWFHLHPPIKNWHLRYQSYLDGTQCWNCNNQDVFLSKPCPNCGAALGKKIKNAFGFRKTYFDRDENLLPQALAWTPQSTVALCTDLGWINVAYGNEFLVQFANAEAQLHSWSEWLCDPDAHQRWKGVAEFLLQVHDSCVFQVRKKHKDLIPQIVKSMEVRVPYPDPLVIPMGYKTSELSWGDCE